MAEPLQIGWIDYGSRDRNKILSVLGLLSQPEAVDELGIGVIRDGFADVLFPGTSTIQTRAKYFLIVPYLLMELEREPGLTPKKLLELLAKAELELIPILSKNGAEGVIGARAGEKLQRRPSSIYWNGLYTFDILHAPERLSLEGYAKAVCRLKSESAQLVSTRHQPADDEDASDDPDAVRTASSGFWRAPQPPLNWRERVTMDLTTEEAAFLRGKIIQSPHSRDSLLAYILKTDSYHVAELEDLAGIPATLPGLPVEIRRACEMAEQFAEFVYGANIRYNLILSGRQNEKVCEEWEAWIQSVHDKGFLRDYDPAEPFGYLKLSCWYQKRTLPFLCQWKDAVLANRTDRMDELIVAREIELKGRERAKLSNPDAYRRQDGSWLGGGKLHYRFRNVKRLLQDIKQGLKDAHA